MMKWIQINLDEFEDYKAFHLWLKLECEFPEYYGCNLDALYDCLSENPEFEFEIIDSIKNPNYQDMLVDTILEAGCHVRIIGKLDGE